MFIKDAFCNQVHGVGDAEHPFFEAFCLLIPSFKAQQRESIFPSLVETCLNTAMASPSSSSSRNQSLTIAIPTQSRWSPLHVSSEESELICSSPRPTILEGCNGPYKDFLGIPVHSVKLQLTTPQSKRKGPRGGVTEPFPLKLYEMLCGVEGEGLTGIVSWRSHGRSFHIEFPKVFVKDVMPRYFKQSKLTSFQRQLNLYGFEKVSSGKDRGTYYHPLFLRGRPELCKIMLRTRVKGGVGAVIYPSDSEESHVLSDFYGLPFCPPSACPQETHQKQHVIQSMDRHHNEISAEVSHSEGDVDSTIFSEDESNSEFQPIPYTYDIVSPAVQWGTLVPFPESTGDSPAAQKADNSEDHYNSISSSGAFPAPDQVLSAPYYRNPYITPFELSDQSDQSMFQPLCMSPSPPIFDFAGRTFQCMDDDCILSYERALRKKCMSHALYE